MKFFREMWAVMATVSMAWLSRINNNTLQIIVNLLTILVILIGLTDWTVRRIRGKRKKMQENEKPDPTRCDNGRHVLEKIESTQKPFKTVQMLDNPMQTGESIGNFVDKISKIVKGEAIMKKFFKWVWYNKEQLFSIMYSIVIIAFSQMAIWTDLAARLMPALSPKALIIVKAIAGVLSLAFTALTVRNVCVPYGLSSLETIDKVLAERAQAEANKLSPERKKELKTFIATLQTTLGQAKNELATAEKALAEITTLYNADYSLVNNYQNRRVELSNQIEQSKTVIANVEAKIADYKAQLEGKTAPKA